MPDIDGKGKAKCDPYFSCPEPPKEREFVLNARGGNRRSRRSSVVVSTVLRIDNSGVELHHTFSDSFEYMVPYCAHFMQNEC